MSEPSEGTAPVETPLVALAQRLEGVDGLPVQQRATLFDQANRALVAELDALDDL
ncbi:MAG TPA: hypothetical protein VGA69_05045 [Nitriliruptorales bacterium]